MGIEVIQRDRMLVESSQLDSTAWVLFLEPVSESITTRSYLAEATPGKTLLGWWSDRLTQSVYKNQWVIVHSESQKNEIDAQLGCSTQTYQSSYTLMLPAVAELARSRRIKTLVVCTLATGLVSVSELDALIDAHNKDDFDFSWIPGLPVGVGAWIMSRAVIDKLMTASLKGLPRNPGLACQRLRASVARGELDRMPFDFNEQATPSEILKSSPSALFPLDINFDRSHDRAILHDVLKTGEFRGSLGLMLWREADIRRKEDIYNLNHAYRLQRCSKEKPVILFIAKSGFSGAEESLCQLIKHLDKDRFELVVWIALEGRIADELGAAGARVIIDNKENCLPYESHTASIGVIVKLQPDIIHLNGIGHREMLYAALDAGIPLVLHVRNGDMSNYREYAESASALISVSRFLNERVCKFSVRKERTAVIYDEVDSEWFCPKGVDRHALRRRYGLPEDALIILMIARFVPNKRHDLILSALPRVLEAVPKAHLLLKGDTYGSDEVYDKVINRIAKVEGAAHITHLKWIDDIRDLYEISDVLVLCSDQEGLGRCVVEAMSMEMPVVVTDSGGSHEIVEDGVTGRIVPGGDASALGNAIVSLLSNEGLAREVGRNARAYVRANLEASLSARAVEKVYHRVLTRVPASESSIP